MWGRTLAAIATGVAGLLLVILISPAVPSPPTTVPTNHTLNPPNVIVDMPGLLRTTAAHYLCLVHELMSSRPAHPTTIDSDLVDVNTVRLC